MSPLASRPVEARLADLEASSQGFTVELAAGPVSLSPIGGTSDDWPRLFAVAAAEGHVRMGSGTWLCKTALIPTSFSTFEMSSDVTVVCSLATGSINNSPFALVCTFGEFIAVTAVNVVGSDTIRVDTSPVGGVGSYYELQLTSSRLSGSTYQIVGITPNGGDFDVKLDRAVLYQTNPATDRFAQVTPPRSVRIEGHGARITGACESYVEVQGAIHPHIEGLVLDATGQTSATNRGGFTSDTFSLRGTFRDIRVIGPGVAEAGYTGAWFIGESHLFERFEVSDCETGVVGADMHEHTIVALTVHTCATPVTVTADGGAAFTPSKSTRFIGCSFYGNTGSGVYIDHTSTAIVFDACSFRGNGSNGVELVATNGAPVNCRFIGCSITENTLNGFADVAGSTGIELIGCDLSDNGGAGLLVAGELFALGLTSKGGNPVAAARIQTGARLTLDGFDILYTEGAAQAFLIEGTAKLRAVNGRLTMSGANSVGFSASGSSVVELNGLRITVNAAVTVALATSTAVISLEDCYTDGTAVGSSVGVNVGSGATIRVNRRVAFDNLAAPFNHNSGALWSRSLTGVAQTFVTANGATGVDVPFTDLKNCDVVKLVRVTDGGTPGPTPRVTKVVGSKFTLTATAGDTSTYAYEIS